MYVLFAMYGHLFPMISFSIVLALPCRISSVHDSASASASVQVKL